MEGFDAFAEVVRLPQPAVAMALKLDCRGQHSILGVVEELFCRALGQWRERPQLIDQGVGRGFAFGVGFEISLACDFRIVSETGFYALPEQRLGQIPGSGGSARLQKIVGITRTKDIVMRSHRIPAKQAYDWGIATECVPDGKLEATTDALVDELRAFSPLAQRTAKKLLNDTEDAMLTTAIELEGHCYSRLRQSDDFKEGVEAFHAKRPAKFKGS